MKAALAAKIAAGTLAAGAAVAAGAVLFIPDGDAGAGQPQAWIDDPLHGTSAPLGTIHITAHAAHAAGITALELAVDDTVLATQQVPGAPAFWLADFEWAAGEPGPAVIRVRARGTEGLWGNPAYATVHIGGRSPVPTPTPSPSAPPGASPTAAPPGPTPTTTTPSTPPPTATPACTNLVVPDLATPADLSDVGTFTPTVDWRYAGPCTPGGFQVQVSSLRDFTAIDRSGSTGGSTTEWTVSPALSDCTTYYWRVRAVTGRIAGAWSSPFGFDVVVGRCL